MKSWLIFLLVVSFTLGQEEKSLSKMDRFVSNSGQIIMLENYNLADLPGYSEKVKVVVRKATVGKDESYYLLLSKEDKYGNKTAAIAEEDLVEVGLALTSLIQKSQLQETSADYLENKFTTEDGFQIGYAKGKSITWFITLEKYGKSTILFDGFDELTMTLELAMEKIEELKNG